MNKLYLIFSSLLSLMCSSPTFAAVEQPSLYDKINSILTKASTDESNNFFMFYKKIYKDEFDKKYKPAAAINLPENIDYSAQAAPVMMTNPMPSNASNMSNNSNSNIFNSNVNNAAKSSIFQ